MGCSPKMRVQIAADMELWQNHGGSRVGRLVTLTSPCRSSSDDAVPASPT
jgi:hypothetical protein